MARVIHVRLYGIAAEERDALHERFADLVGCREWRDQLPWLADAYSADLFGQLFFEQVIAEDIREHPEGSDLSAAAFIAWIMPARSASIMLNGAYSKTELLKFERLQ